MKKSLLKLVIVVATVVAIACSGKKDNTVAENKTDSTQVAPNEWKEMDEFHLIMAESFHPYKDSSNLEPAKLNAADMAANATSWVSASLPEKVNNENVKGKLELLKTQTATFAETVKSGDDKVIGEDLTKLHDLFHEIQEAWYGGEGHHHHHGDH